MLAAKFLLGFAGLALFISNRRVAAPYRRVEFLLTFSVLCYLANEFTLSALGFSTDHIMPWYLPSDLQIPRIVLSTVYVAGVFMLNQSMIVALRPLALRARSTALLAVSRIFSFTIATISVVVHYNVFRFAAVKEPSGCLENHMYIRRFDRMLASFAVANYALPILDIAVLVVLTITKRGQQPVERRLFDILSACVSLLLISRLCVVAGQIFPDLSSYSFFFRTTPEALVIFVAAFYARDFSLMATPPANVELPLTAEPPKQQIVDEKLTFVDDLVIITEEKVPLIETVVGTVVVESEVAVAVEDKVDSQ